MASVNHALSDKPIATRRETVERLVAAFGKPVRVNSRELVFRLPDKER